MTPPLKHQYGSLPHNLEAEKSVLGGLLIDSSGYDAVARIVQPKDFFRDAHRKIFTCLTALADRDSPLDIVSVKEELSTHPAANGETWLDDAGGPAYVASLVDGVPRSTNVKAYAEIVREKATLRGLIFLADTMLKQGYANDAEAKRIVKATDAALTALSAEARLSVGAVSIGDVLPAINEEIERRSGSAQVPGFSSGIVTLDAYTLGWNPGDMVVIAAETSFGKSVLALDLARAMAMAGERVVYYSFEMSKESLTKRLLASISGVPLGRIRFPKLLAGSDWAKLADAQEVIAQLPIEINDTESRSINDIRAECRQIKAERGLSGVFLDHFQLMDGVEGDNRATQLATVSRKIQSLGNELDVVTFPLSQLTMTESREPNLNDLRDCKSLGHDASHVLMLHPHKPSEARSGEVSVVKTKCLIRKQREGPLGTVWLDLERDYVRFVAGEAPLPTPKEPKESKRAKPLASPSNW